MKLLMKWKRIGRVWLTNPMNRVTVILCGAILVAGIGLLTITQTYMDVRLAVRSTLETGRIQWEQKQKLKKYERMTVIFEPGQTDGGLLAAVDRKLSGLGLSGNVRGIEPMPIKDIGMFSLEEVSLRLSIDGTNLPMLLREFETGDDPLLVRHLSLSRVRIGDGSVNGEIRIQRLVRRE